MASNDAISQAAVLLDAMRISFGGSRESFDDRESPGDLSS
jgi:hypothetical protein